jgi:hypothetical protein
LFSFFSPPDPLVVRPENEEEALVTIMPLLEDPLETTKHFFRLFLSPSAKNATFVDVVEVIFVLFFVFIVVVIIAASLLLFSTSSWTLIVFLPLGKILLPDALSLLLLLDGKDDEEEVDNEEEGEEHQRRPKGI